MSYPLLSAKWDDLPRTTPVQDLEAWRRSVCLPREWGPPSTIRKEYAEAWNRQIEDLRLQIEGSILYDFDEWFRRAVERSEARL